MTHTDESYSKLEAEAMIGRRFITRVSFCEKLPAGTNGTVIDAYPRGDGGYGVSVEWHQPGRTHPDRDAFSRDEVEDYLVGDHRETIQQRLAFYARYEFFLGKIADAVHEERSLEEIKNLVDSAMITDDCPVCTHPWGYCICKA